MRGADAKGGDLATSRSEAEDEFIYSPENRHQRQETERFRAFSYEELIKRDKSRLDIFWLKDESLHDSENLPDPEVQAAEIVEKLESALEQFKSIAQKVRV